MSDRPARYGPFHRRTRHNPNENTLVAESGVIQGKPPGNFYAGFYACVQAWNGPLPEGIVGYEFYTNVEPDPGSPPQSPEWSEGRPGVRVLERNGLVEIAVVITMRRDAE